MDREWLQPHTKHTHIKWNVLPFISKSQNLPRLKKSVLCTSYIQLILPLDWTRCSVRYLLTFLLRYDTIRKYRWIKYIYNEINVTDRNIRMNFTKRRWDAGAAHWTRPGILNQAKSIEARDVCEQYGTNDIHRKTSNISFLASFFSVDYMQRRSCNYCAIQIAT